MYITTLSDAEVSNLRQHGFIHITGFPYKAGDKQRSVHFKKDVWGKWHDDSLGATLVIAKNGEVWLRCAPYSEIDILQSLSSVCPKGRIEDIEISRSPYFFSTILVTSDQWRVLLLSRTALPYWDFMHGVPPDPSHYES